MLKEFKPQCRNKVAKATQFIESLESRMLLAADLKFAVIGDYSSDLQSQPETDVSALVHSWNPAFIATVGDNNYPDGAASTIDANIGQFYHDYIAPYKGTRGSGSASGNRFWPTLGNHDWDTGTSQPYTNYFTLPNNGRYYTMTQGNVALFMIDADPREPDGNTATSVQGKWIQAQMAASTAKWKLVLFHQPAYSSGASGDNVWMQWPFAQWGASAVIAGHDHDYERLSENGIPYFVNGLGGESIFSFNSPVPGSQVRYESDYGAMLLDATDTSLNFQFINRGGLVIDSYTLGAPAAPAAPTNLTAVAVSSNQINLRWTDNSVSSAASFSIERSLDGKTFAQIATTGPGVTTYSNTGLSASTLYYYQVRAFNAAGQSAYTAIASTSTPAAAPFTYLSDLQWASATTGYGTIGKDLSISGTPITMHGVVYTKGIGTHAVSQIVYNLAGKYTNFISDIGVDDKVSGSGSIIFQVKGDGKLLFDSGVLISASTTASLNVNVTGVQQLTLIANNGVAGSINYDHADWAGARLGIAPVTPTLPAAPSGLTAAASFPPMVSLNWIDNALGNENGFIIQRSVDDKTFAPIGTTGAGVTTYSDSANLTVGSTYYYRVVATNSVGNSGFSNEANAIIPAAASQVTYVSDLIWASATTGYGTIGKDKSVNGTPLTLRGTVYAKGIGTHAVSQIVYNLNGQYSSFLSDIGVDDEVNGKGTGQVDFQVIGDGVILYDSGVLTNAGPVVHVSVSVAGVQKLTLVASNGVVNSISYDHADWANARLLSTSGTPAVPSAPTGLAATALSSSQVKLTWTNTAANQTGIQVDRSPDNVTFTALPGTLAATASTYTDSGLTAGATYYYRVRATNGTGSSPPSAAVKTTTLPATATTTYVSDLPWTSATSGWGTVQKDKSVGGRALNLRGTTYAKGLGTHALSQIVYDLNGKYSNFLSDIGVDDEEVGHGNASVIFQLMGDGKVLFDSGILTTASPVVSVNVSVVGIKTLTLVVKGGIANSIDYDHADWANARLT